MASKPNKRPRTDNHEMDTSVRISPFMPMFEAFRDELDEHHDRRERIIKASRDITALSKKISALIVVAGLYVPCSVRQLQAVIPADVAKDNEPRQTMINSQFGSVSPDLQGINAWRYQKQISGGIQEYTEAISFQHYLETQHLITYEEAQAAITGGVSLTEDDYVLGLFDLVGELMRFAITSMATNGALPRGPASNASSAQCSSNEDKDILTDLRSLRTYFESLDISRTGSGSSLKRDLEMKMKVMKECVEKVENAVCGMIVRGRERPKGWIPDTVSEERGREQVESY